MTDAHGRPTHTNIWRGVLFAALLGAIGGAAVGYRIAMRRVDVLQAYGDVLVDGRVAWNVRACERGCRTEDDVALERAIMIVRGK